MELVHPFCHRNLFQPCTQLKICTSQAMQPSIRRLKAKKFEVNQRRSANYHPSIWEPKLIDSLSTPYSQELHATKLGQLKQETRSLLATTRDPSALLMLVHSIRRLGIAYHLEKEIRDSTDLISQVAFDDLHSTSLQFRLTREIGYPISSEVFDKFRDERGNFAESLRDDVPGLLSLYEASHLGIHGEDDLEEAKHFSTKHLKAIVVGKLENKLADEVQQSLEIPIHRRMPRLDARKFIDAYFLDNAKSSILLELAKLDYNLVQSVYQKELKELSRWWTDLGFKEKLSFSRDRLMENYLWAMGIVFEPHFSECRKGLAKFVCILTAIDDMYDVYGSLDELECFTNAVSRWSMEAMKEIPDYMRPCYSAMLDFGNAMAYNVQKDYGLNILPHVQDEWTKLCRSYLVEARWFYGAYTPTLDEYLRNAWISVGGHAAIVHAYLLLGFDTTNSSLDCLKLSSEAIYWASLVCRLTDDLGTSKAEMMRGDVSKSIQCYMIQEGVSEEQARHHIKDLISLSWKKLNEERAKNFIPKSIKNMSLNMARTAHCIFQHGDGIGTSTGMTKEHLTSLIVTPILL